MATERKTATCTLYCSYALMKTYQLEPWGQLLTDEQVLYITFKRVAVSCTTT